MALSVNGVDATGDVVVVGCAALLLLLLMIAAIELEDDFTGV